jgi:predicted double-glycine peptidase
MTIRPASASPRPAVRPPVAAGATQAKAPSAASQQAQPTTRDVRNFGAFLENQGHTMGCGTTSLAMLLSFWNNRPQAYTREKVDSQIRHFEMTTMPDTLKRYAESQGMRAVVRNNATIDDLTRMLDQGVPTQVLYDRIPNGKDVMLHYVVPVSYTRDAQGQVSTIRIADPKYGRIDELPIEEFKRRWDDLQLAGLNTGLNNVMIPMVPKADVPIRDPQGRVRRSVDIALPGAQDVPTSAKLLDKFTGLVNRFGRWIDSLKH